MYEANGKIYTLEEVKDYWRAHSFVCYNDKDFFEWLENQAVFAEVSEAKRKALETLEQVKRIYEESASELLCAGFYDEFMAVVNGQIEEIKRTTN